MAEPRAQHEAELIAAIRDALPGVRVEALAGEEQLQGQVQNWPAVFLVLSSIEYERAAAIGAPDRQASTWTWTVFCHGRKAPPPPEKTAYDLAEAVTAKLAGYRLSDALAGPVQVVREEMFALLYESQVRMITVQYFRGRR